jgi:hypothetical protein
MSYTLSNLLRDALRYEGTDAWDVRVATSGSTTTMIDTVLEDKYGDDDLKDGTILVARTTDNLAPVNEFSRISAYAESTMTTTFDALTTAIGAGDTCMLISNEYPLRVLIELANDALRDCGEISLVDSTTVTVADANEYALSVNWKNLVSVDLQTETDITDNNAWMRINNYRIIPSASGTDATIEFEKPFDADYKLRFIYNAFHEQISLYNSPINEAIPAPLITLMLADKIMQWHGVNNENQNYANKILSELEDAKRKYPVRRNKHLLYKYLGGR